MTKIPYPREQIRFWRDVELRNLELLLTTYVTHTFAPHMHDGYVIGVIEQGVEQFRYQKTRHVATDGCIVLINPAEMHSGSFTSEQGCIYKAFHLPIEALQQATSDLTGRHSDLPFFPEPLVHDPEVMAQLLLTHHSIAEGASTLEREARLLWTLAQLLTRYADARPRPAQLPKEPKGIGRVRSYLEEYYAENISLSFLATIAQLSPFHLLRVFRSQMQLPPHAYQMQIRVMRAKQLLQTGMPCVDAALAVGFADQSHLTKHFKRIVGVSPGVYRNAHKK